MAVHSTTSSIIMIHAFVGATEQDSILKKNLAEAPTLKHQRKCFVIKDACHFT